MCAAQHDAVGTCVQQGLQGGAAYLFGFGRRKVTGFYQFYEAPAHAFYNFNIGSVFLLCIEIERAFERSCGCKYPDDSAFSTQRCRLDGRFHPYERNGVTGSEC